VPGAWKLYTAQLRLQRRYVWARAEGIPVAGTVLRNGTSVMIGITWTMIGDDVVAECIEQ
jgi:hypothetical protein